MEEKYRGGRGQNEKPWCPIDTWDIARNLRWCLDLRDLVRLSLLQYILNRFLCTENGCPQPKPALHSDNSYPFLAHSFLQSIVTSWAAAQDDAHGLPFYFHLWTSTIISNEIASLACSRPHTSDHRQVPPEVFIRHGSVPNFASAYLLWRTPILPRTM